MARREYWQGGAGCLVMASRQDPFLKNDAFLAFQHSRGRYGFTLDCPRRNAVRKQGFDLRIAYHDEGVPSPVFSVIRQPRIHERGICAFGEHIIAVIAGFRCEPSITPDAADAVTPSDIDSIRLSGWFWIHKTKGKITGRPACALRTKLYGSRFGAPRVTLGYVVDEMAALHLPTREPNDVGDSDF